MVSLVGQELLANVTKGAVADARQVLFETPLLNDSYWLDPNRDRSLIASYITAACSADSSSPALRRLLFQEGLDPMDFFTWEAENPIVDEEIIRVLWPSMLRALQDVDMAYWDKTRWVNHMHNGHVMDVTAPGYSLADLKAFMSTDLCLHVRNPAYIEKLLAHPAGIDINYHGEGGLSALIMCIVSFHPKSFLTADQANCMETARLLLNRQDIDVNHRCRVGMTALMLACAVNAEEAVKLLLAHPSIDVNDRNLDGYTALYIATTVGLQSIVALLLAHPDINVNIRNKHHLTPLDVAYSQSRTDIMDMLVANGGIMRSFTRSMARKRKLAAVGD